MDVGIPKNRMISICIRPNDPTKAPTGHQMKAPINQVSMVLFSVAVECREGYD
jgi:hypothetical protein